MNAIGRFSYALINLILITRNLATDEFRSSPKFGIGTGLLFQDDPVGIMTTHQPIEGYENFNCSAFDTCEECSKQNCVWIQCQNVDTVCSQQPDKLCPQVECSTTVEPSTTTELPITTTVETTTSSSNDNDTTTEPPTTTTTTTSTTTTPTTTTTGTTTTTTSSTTQAPNTTTSTTAVPTTAKPPSNQRHFDAASFVGGIILSCTLTLVAFAGWKFYQKRLLANSYSNF